MEPPSPKPFCIVSLLPILFAVGFCWQGIKYAQVWWVADAYQQEPFVVRRCGGYGAGNSVSSSTGSGYFVVGTLAGGQRTMRAVADSGAKFTSIDDVRAVYPEGRSVQVWTNDQVGEPLDVLSDVFASTAEIAEYGRRTFLNGFVFAGIIAAILLTPLWALFVVWRLRWRREMRQLGHQ